MFKEKTIKTSHKIKIFNIKTLILFFIYILFTMAFYTNNVNANEKTTMPNGESYEDGWIRPQSCLHNETLIKARIQGRDYSETMRAFLNNIQTNDTLGIGKPIKDLIHFNLDDTDKQAFNYTTSTLINLAIHHTNNNTGKAVGVYSDGTINTKYKGAIQTISYKGHESDPKYVYGPSKDPDRFPNVAWTPAENIRVINPKTNTTSNTQLAQNLKNVLPNATLAATIPTDAYPPPNKNGIIVVNIPQGRNNFSNFTLNSPSKGIDLLAVNYSLKNKAPYIHLDQLSNYVNKYRNNIEKIIFPTKDAYTHLNQIAEFLTIDPIKIDIPTPYKNNNLQNLNPTDASAKILNDIYPNTNKDIYNTLDTIFITKQPYNENNNESLAWESDFLAALSLAVNKPTEKQAIALVNAATGKNTENDPITTDLKNTIKKLAPGNVFISGGAKAIAMPITEKTLGTLSRSEKPQWLDKNSPECKHDNPKLEIKKTLISEQNHNEKLDINQNVEYQIQITNKAESGIARNTHLIEKALDGLELINYKINNISHPINNNKAEIILDEIRPQEHKTIIVQGITRRSSTSRTINISYIQNKTPNEKQNCETNEKTCSITINRQKTPNLQISKTLNNGKTNVNVNEEVEYNLTVTNIGDGQTDAEVKIFDTPVKGLKNLNNQTFNVGIIQGGQSKTVKVKGIITENTEKITENIANTCFGNSCIAKNNCENNDNTCSKNILTHNIPELSLNKTHENEKAITQNNDTFFNITVSNNSDYPAHNVVIEDNPIHNLTDTEFINIPIGTIKNNKWEIPIIEARQSYTTKVKAKVINTDYFENNACLQAEYIEKFCVNNKYQDNSSIKVTKELVNNDDNNQTAQYKITVTNKGTTNSRNLTLKDKMTIQTINKNETPTSSNYYGKYGFTQIEQGRITEDGKNWEIGSIAPNQTITAIVQVHEAPPNLPSNTRIINEIFPIDYPNCNNEKHREECASTVQGGIKITKTLINEEKNLQNKNTTRKILSGQKIKFKVDLENLSEANSYHIETIDIGGNNIENPKFIDIPIGKTNDNKWNIDILPAGQKVTGIVEATVKTNTYISEQEISNTVYTSSRLFYPNKNSGRPHSNLQIKNNPCETNNPYCSTITLKEKSNIKIHKTLIEKGIKTYDGKYTWNIQITNTGDTAANNVKIYEILTPQIKNIKWNENPNIGILQPKEIKNITVTTTIANPNILKGIMQNTAIVEADNYKPITNDINKDSDNNTIPQEKLSFTCQDNTDIESDTDRCDIAKENYDDNPYTSLANTGFTKQLIILITILSILGIHLKHFQRK